MALPRLYSYFRSSAAYRVRIALALKHVVYETCPVHLLRDGGEHYQAHYRAVNPQGLVPSFVDEAGTLGQSLAIMEYLDTLYPDPPLLPADPRAMAEVRAMAEAVACDIHPLNNLRVLAYLRREFGADEDAVARWYRHWIAEGLAPLEALALRHSRGFCWGDTVTLADLCLVPQLYNARRFAVDLAPYPTLTAIDARCRALPAFIAAAPENQPDAA
jgi:maleylacetoacetate isomerase